MLGELCRKVPQGICNADIKKTREWRNACDRAKKVLGNKRSSVTELTSAVNHMSTYA